MKLIFFVLFVLSQARNYERLMDLLETSISEKELGVTPYNAWPMESEEEVAGECDVRQVSTWGGKIAASYTQCSGIPAAATFVVKVSDITGIRNCPLFNDWVFSVGCPNGICPLNIGFEVSFDMCDLIAAIATGGASAAAKAAAQQVGKMVAKQLSKTAAKKAAQAAANNIGNKLKKKVRNSNVGQGLCNGIDASIGVALKCLFNSNQDIRIPGLREALDIFNAGITLKLEAKMQFNINARRIEGVEMNLSFGVKLSEAAPATWALTLLAKGVNEIPSPGCDKNNPAKIAKEMTAGINITPNGISGQFEITCGNSQIFKTMEQIGGKLKEGARELDNAMRNAHGDVKNKLQQAKNGLRDVCRSVKSKKNECKNVSKKVCGWSGRRQMDEMSFPAEDWMSDENKNFQTDAEDEEELNVNVADFLSVMEDDAEDEAWEAESTERRNLFSGRRRRRWINPVKWLCNWATDRVCSVVDVFHC